MRRFWYRWAKDGAARAGPGRLADPRLMQASRDDAGGSLRTQYAWSVRGKGAAQHRTSCHTDGLSDPSPHKVLTPRRGSKTQRRFLRLALAGIVVEFCDLAERVSQCFNDTSYCKHIWCHQVYENWKYSSEMLFFGRHQHGHMHIEYRNSGNNNMKDTKCTLACKLLRMPAMLHNGCI